MAAGIQLATATALAVAAAGKLAAPRAFIATLGALGVRPLQVVRYLVPLGELAVAVSLVTAPRSPLTVAATVGLGVAFAAVGAWALVRGQRIECACFGVGEATLGWRQIAALPAWIAAGVLPGAWATTLDGRSGATALSATLAAVAAVRAVTVLRHANENRAFRAIAASARAAR